MAAKFPYSYRAVGKTILIWTRNREKKYQMSVNLF